MLLSNTFKVPLTSRTTFEITIHRNIILQVNYTKGFRNVLVTRLDKIIVMKLLLVLISYKNTEDSLFSFR